MISVTGKLVDLSNDRTTLIIEDKCSNRYLINSGNLFGNIQIGSTLTAGLIPRFGIDNIIQNSNGNYKLISFIKDTNNLGINYLKFKNNSTGEFLTSAVQIPSLGDNILGINYDLIDIKEVYTALNVLPNLKENNNKLYSKVTITSEVFKNIVYQGIYDNKIIYIKSNEPLYKYIGQTVLAELVRKYFGNYIIPGEEELPSQKVVSNIIFIDNKLNYVQELLLDCCGQNSNNLKNINNNLSILSNAYSIDPNNIGKIITYENYNFKFIIIQSIRLTENKSDIKLISILYDDTDFKSDYIYLFQTSGPNAEIFVSRPNKFIDLSDKIGSYFSFIYLPIYYLLGNLSESGDNSYKFESLLENNIHLFSKDGEFFYVDVGPKIIPSSLIGNNFRLDLKLYNYSNNILDITDKI